MDGIWAGLTAALKEVSSLLPESLDFKPESAQLEVTQHPPPTCPEQLHVFTLKHSVQAQPNINIFLFVSFKTVCPALLGKHI